MKINKKFTVLSLILALMFSFILTSNVHASTNGGWHKGAPKILRHKRGYSTGYVKHKGTKNVFNQPYYSQSITGFGDSILSTVFNMKMKNIGGGIPSSAFAGMNPHYKYIGHNYYIIKAGAMPDKHHSAIYYEFHDGGYGDTNLVKVHDKNHIYIWSFDSNKSKNNKLNSKKSYIGYFTANNK